MSLKQVLSQEIRTMGTVPYSRIVDICLEEGAKVSAAERRLREIMSESSSIKPIYRKSKKGTNYIAGYLYEPVVTQGTLN